MVFIEIILLIVIIGILVKQQGGIKSLPLIKPRGKLILDSCALIDGRILEVVRAGFVSDELILPQFILNEMQLLADGQDAHKRERARFGLDVAHELQNDQSVRVSIDRITFSDIRATDDKLVVLAKKLNARLYTTDYNLSKIAAVEGVRVLNINELAQNLRPVSLPGETVIIKIVQRGENSNQGVGYLEDGTMVVVDGAVRMIGKKIEATVDRMHQTVAGKMVFAHALKDFTKPSQPTQSNVNNHRSLGALKDRFKSQRKQQIS